MRKKVLIGISFIAICFMFFTTCIANKKHTKELNIDKIKSINLSTDYEINQALKDVDLLGANAVNVPVVINIPNLTSNEMVIDENSKKKAIKIIKILKKKDIKIILEAYPWINNGSDYETMYNPENKEKFFKDWEDILYILIKDIANEYNVDILITASSFNYLEQYESQWCSIINFAKNNFDGLVTYKTSWWYTAKWDSESIDKYNKKLNNKLFSKVDFISIASYFELSDKENNSVDNLVNALYSTTVHGRGQNVFDEIYNFYKKYNKQIFFAELGFPRKDGASTQPWNSNVSSIENPKEQARCFKSYKEVFEDKDFIKGFSVFALGQKGDDKNFYPSNESIEVISSWYEK